MRPICRFGLSFSSPSEAHQLVKGPQILLSISISGSYLIQPRSFCTRMTVLFDVTLRKVLPTQERLVRALWVLVGEFP